jgi:uncharacterized protein (DUF849 family)
MKRKVMICCAITGGSDNYRRSKAVPVTPEQIAESAIEAAHKGASVVHIHVRDPETGAASMDVGLYREVYGAVRAAVPDLVINLTTGIGGRFVPSEADPSVADAGTTIVTPQRRAQHVLELRPDACSLDMGTMNLGSTPFLNTPAHIRTIAALAREAGTMTELEVFDAGHIELAKSMMAAGEVCEPGLFQLCLGVSWGAPATVDSISYLSRLLPPKAIWFAFGVGRDQFPVVAMTMLLGGHVRVGLEDNLYLEQGVPAQSNAQLVMKAANIIELLGGEVACRADARQLLGLEANRPSLAAIN